MFHDGWWFFGMHGLWWLFWIFVIVLFFAALEPIPRRVRRLSSLEDACAERLLDHSASVHNARLNAPGSRKMRASR